MDVAVDGDGFFQILMPDGNIGYTRNGTFSRNADGLMTTSSGYVLATSNHHPFWIFTNQYFARWAGYRAIGW